jgi:isocitrate/isopropylmalate dehydrogenase
MTVRMVVNPGRVDALDGTNLHMGILSDLAATLARLILWEKGWHRLRRFGAP